MMKEHLRSGLIVIIVTILLATGNCLAKSTNQNHCEPSGGQPPKCNQVPEIDTGAGGRAIVLLVGVLLLTAEKRRRSF
jgi:hypothetical protein